MKTLALFDLDGTLTKRDTFISFIRYVHGDLQFIWGMLLCLPWIVGYKTGLIPNWKAKERVLSYFFSGMPQTRFEEYGLHFAEQILPGLFKPDMAAILQQHVSKGNQIAIVTASLETWVKPWADRMGFTCIASDVERKEGVITGKIIPANCYGPEKERRIREKFILEDYHHIKAYGNSRGDLEMLKLAK